MLLQAVFGAGFELVKIPAGLGNADDRHVKVSPLYHGLKRRENLLVGKIAGGSEENQCVRMGRNHNQILISLSSK